MGNNNRSFQNNRIDGNHNVMGDHNIVNSRKEEHYHQHNHKHSTKNTNDDDVKGIVGGLIFALVVAVWMFVKHASEIYFYLKLGAIVTALPYLAICVLGLFSTPPDNKHITAMVFGLAMSGIAFLFAQNAQDSLDPRLIQFSQEAQNAWTFWTGLSEYGHHLVVGNLVGAICLAATLIFALLMGLFVLFHYLLDTDIYANAFLRLLTPFRPNRGGIFSALMLIVSWAYSSGLVFQIIGNS